MRHRHTVAGMITILSALVSLLSFRVRSRAYLELELIALRHQVSVLRRRRPGRARLFCADRLLWVVGLQQRVVFVAQPDNNFNLRHCKCSLWEWFGEPILTTHV